MRYLKKELLLYDNNSKEAQEYHEQLWREQCVKLDDAQKKGKHKLPKKLWEILKDTAFHDAIIESINIARRVKNYQAVFDITLTLRSCDGKATYELLYKDVSSFKTDLHLENLPMHFDYLYGEFLYEDKNYIHNFLAFDYCETNIVCNKIEIKEL